MLTIPLESLVVLAKHSLEKVWSDSLRISAPHLIDELSPCLDYSAVRAKRVLPLTLNKGLVLLLEEVLSELIGVLDALDRACLLYTSPSPRDVEESRMPSSA